MLRLAVLGLGFAAGSGDAAAATKDAAADYPNRPIRMVVPFPPGGATDILARVVGKRMTDA
ncbi:MAG: tripartite tricarboxylate transporter substrate binding protein, partial [Burkholderiales bacterium]